MRARYARNVLIYGAGTTGVQLLEALRRSGNHVPIGFIDMNPTVWGQYVAGLKVYRPDRMPALCSAMTSAKCCSPCRRPTGASVRRRCGSSTPLGVVVRTLPAIEDLAFGRATVSDLRPVSADDLLGRDPVPPNADLLARNIREQVGDGDRRRRLDRLGAGAGDPAAAPAASCFSMPPSRSSTHRARDQRVAAGKAATVGPQVAAAPEIVAVLGSVLDGPRVRQLIENNAVDTIYHAAAFKHVPIVEHNAVAGLRNNVFGTRGPAEAAERCGVERFVLISTDKAVRPTSIMGASKRLAEMVLQARAASGSAAAPSSPWCASATCSTARARWCGVSQQIEAGGPVTVTAPRRRSAISCRSRRRRRSSSRPAPWPRAATCSSWTWASR